MPVAVIPVFDGHNDALTRDDYAALASGRSGGHIDLPRMRAGGMRGGIFAVFTPSPDEQRTPVARDDGVLEYALPPEVPREHAAGWATQVAGRLFALERAGELRIAREVADIDRAFADGGEAPPPVAGVGQALAGGGAPPPDAGGGPPVAVLHFEGAEAIDTGLEALELWYGAGLRSLGPVWSRPNRFAHGVPFIFPSSPDTGPGLTDAGRALVRRCAELGVLVDLSHLNEAGFWDVARLEAGPLVASHAGVHALAPCSRNLTDRQLDAIRDSDGLIGIVYSTRFLRADFNADPATPLALIARHARYVADRIGVRHLALGSDFDGTEIPDALGDVSGLPRLLEALRTAGGFNEAELTDIAWRNWRRVLAAWWRR